MLPRPHRQVSVSERGFPRRLPLAGGLVLLASCLLLPRLSAGAQAPLIGWGWLEKSIEGGYSMDRQTTSVGNAPDSHFDSDRYYERLNLRDNHLFVLDPRLMTLNLGAGVELNQEKNDFNGNSGSLHGTLVDYSLNSTFLAEKPYNLFVYANRSDNQVYRNFGTRTHVTTTVNGARANLHEGSFLKELGFPYFASSLGVSQLKSREESVGVGQEFRRNEDHNILQFDASKGFLTADLALHYQYDAVKDNLLANNDYNSSRGNLNYSLDFGPTLNRRWNSIMNYYKRSGRNDTELFTANENLLVHHNVDLFSSYQYAFNQFRTSTGSTTSNSVTMLVNKRTYRNLTSAVNVQGAQVDLPEGQTRNWGGGPSFGYRRHIPANGILTLHANGSYRITENNLDSSTVSVQNESHIATSNAAGGFDNFYLDHPFVDPASIVILDTAGAPVTLAAGVDYDVVADGDRIQIRLVPTSAIVQANDPLEAGYTYTVNPSIKFSTTYTNVGGGVNFGWLSFSTGRDASRQNRLSGTDNGYLQDRTLDYADLRLRGDWQRLRAGADAGYQREDSTSQKYTRWTFGQSASYPRLFGMMLTAGATESFTSYRDPVSRRSESYSANVSLSGVIGQGWLTRAVADILILRDTNIETQTTRRAGIDTRRNIGKLTLTGNLMWDSYERGTAQTVDRRIELTAKRRF